MDAEWHGGATQRQHYADKCKNTSRVCIAPKKQ